MENLTENLENAMDELYSLEAKIQYNYSEEYSEIRDKIEKIVNEISEVCSRIDKLQSDDDGTDAIVDDIRMGLI